MATLPVAIAINKDGVSSTPDAVVIRLVKPDFSEHTAYKAASVIEVGEYGTTFTLSDSDVAGMYHAILKATWGADIARVTLPVQVSA